MVGGPCSPKTPFHKKEGHAVAGEALNVDITSPGATLALGMLFFDTGPFVFIDCVVLLNQRCPIPQEMRPSPTGWTFRKLSAYLRRFDPISSC
jgi:hypothetical protein